MILSSKTRKLRAGTPMEEPGTLSFRPLARECREGPGPTILIDIYICIFAGPSAQRRVGILCGWFNGQRVLLSIDPGDPSRPETWRRGMAFVPLATPWRSTARFFKKNLYIGRVSKNLHFLASHQNVKNQRIIETGKAMSPLWNPKHDF